MINVLSIIFESVCKRIQKWSKKCLLPDVTPNNWFRIFIVLFIYHKYSGTIYGTIYGTLYYSCLDYLSYRVKEVKSKCSIGFNLANWNFGLPKQLDNHRHFLCVISNNVYILIIIYVYHIGLRRLSRNALLDSFWQT